MSRKRRDFFKIKTPDAKKSGIFIYFTSRFQRVEAILNSLCTIAEITLKKKLVTIRKEIIENDRKKIQAWG